MSSLVVLVRTSPVHGLGRRYPGQRRSQAPITEARAPRLGEEVFTYLIAVCWSLLLLSFRYRQVVNGQKQL